MNIQFEFSVGKKTIQFFLFYIGFYLYNSVWNYLVSSSSSYLFRKILVSALNPIKVTRGPSFYPFLFLLYYRSSKALCGICLHHCLEVSQSMERTLTNKILPLKQRSWVRATSCWVALLNWKGRHTNLQYSNYANISMDLTPFY